MLTRVILPALLATALFAGPVLAKGAEGRGQMPEPEASMERCQSLQTELDGAIKSHGKAARRHEAEMLRAAGGELCAGGSYADGIAKLRQGLRDLGSAAKG